LSSDANSSSNSPPPEKPHTRQATKTAAEHRSYRRSSVWVNILLEKLSWSSSPPVIHIVNNDRTAPVNVHLAPLTGPSSVPLSFSHHRLCNMEPTVTFVSPCALALQCSFSVFLDGSALPIRTEVTPIKCHSSPMQSSGWVYSALLIPGFWKSLCEDVCMSSPNNGIHTAILTFWFQLRLDTLSYKTCSLPAHLPLF